MVNKYFKFLIIVLAIAFIVPQITLAAWWNPFSWNLWNIDFHKQTQLSQPTVCPMYCLQNMLCGSDGKDYCNECLAKSAGVTVAHQGKCEAQANPQGLSPMLQIGENPAFNFMLPMPNLDYNSPEPVYKSYLIDLNRDGRLDLLFFPTVSEGNCGSGGCTLYIYINTEKGFEFLNSVSVIHGVYLANSYTNGWRDLVVTVGGGGYVGDFYKKLKYNGKVYPGNPTTDGIDANVSGLKTIL